SDGIKSTISDSVFLGLNTHFFISLPNKQTIEIIHESVMDSSFRKGDTIYLNIKTDKINVFSKDGNRNLISAN
ncbi:MAG: TOBE domain-containing protein, partial [Spirochaetales bacterium]|nr:TOBE domain-containing protein [Spirochaetales bacterium]